MGGDERTGARTGQTDGEQPGRRSTLAQVGGYLFRGVLSAVALVCAGLVVATLGGVAAPLPDRGLAQPTPAAIAAPAALPKVPVPVRSLPSPQQPAGQAGAPAGPQEGAADAPLEPDLAPAAPQVAFSAWAARLSPVTGIPQRALQAYANAHAAMAATQPECQITWVTLAGIARVESNHGGGRLGPDGRSSPPIIGIQLNGAPGVRSIADTDGGLLDGDRLWDHAVGPFQFIPSTWAVWRSDGDGDGVAEPQDIDDAAVAAARYLCADGRNLSGGDGWLRAILSYNSSVDYVQKVYAAAQQYARSAQSVS